MVKVGLKGSRLTRKRKARILEATVDSCLSYDFQVNVWWKREFDRL